MKLTKEQIAKIQEEWAEVKQMRPPEFTLMEYEHKASALSLHIPALLAHIAEMDKELAEREMKIGDDKIDWAFDRMEKLKAEIREADAVKPHLFQMDIEAIDTLCEAVRRKEPAQ